MPDYTYLSALDALVATRPMLDPNNYGDLASYRRDQRRNARDAADYRLLRLYVKPTNEELREAARGSRIEFVHALHTLKDTLADREPGVRADYCAGQYYPVEYRAACVRLLARVWWVEAAKQHHVTAQSIRNSARRLFGSGIARRWFN